MPELPEYIATSPTAFACPECNAKPGDVCEVLNDELAIVHIARIKLAVAMDLKAKKAGKQPSLGMPGDAVTPVR
jgi:hypothetical protein